MIAKYAGKCAGCGERFSAGSEVAYDRGAKKITSCPSCHGAAQGMASSSGFAAAPAAPRDEIVPFVGTPLGAEPVPASAIPPRVIPLDEHQLAVVALEAGTALVAAGAGSGKSTTLIERQAALAEAGCIPEQVVTLVFNRSAAVDFRAKNARRFGEQLGSRFAIQTFHAFAFALLRMWFPAERRFSSNRIIGLDDGPNGYRLATQAMKAAGIETGEPGDYMAASGMIREALIDLDAADAADKIAEMEIAAGSLRVAEELAAFSRAYQAGKLEAEAIDFSDMLCLVCDEIRKGTERARALTTIYRHVQVDEGQDINPARLLIAKHLGSGAQSLVFVGDLRQSIYGFTGSRPDLFRGLLDDGAQLLTLPVNRRSAQAIVEAGNKIADGREWNLGGACSAAPGAGAGEPVRIWNTADAISEAQQVAAEIKRTITTGLPLADEKGNANYACLARTNAAGAALESALLAAGLQVRVLGAHGGVWSTSVGRDVLAYLRAAEGVAHEDLTRVANKPLRYAKRAAVTDAVAWAKREGLRVSETLARCGDRGAFRLSSDLSRLARLPWPERCQEIAETLVGDLHERAAEAAANGAAARAAKPDEDREAAVKALCTAAETAGSLQAIEDQIRKMKEEEKQDGQKKPAVEISTIHRSKGLEWSYVFVCGATEGQLPHANATDVEEERRLFYVAVTRAKHVATISIGSSAPSPFLADLGWHPEPEPDGDGFHSEEKVTVEPPVEIPPEALDLPAPTGTVGDATLTPIGITVEAPPEPEPEPEPARLTLDELTRAIDAARPGAEAATEAEPHSSGSGAGSRFVEVERGDFDVLLTPLGFEPTEGSTQVVYVRACGALVFRVYSTIPLAAEAARDLGADSIKVTVTWQDTKHGGAEGCYGRERPLHKKLPYAARTRGWRLAVLDRLAELVELAREARPCICGGLMVKRESKNGPFLGCLRFPECKKTDGLAEKTKRVPSQGALG